MHICLLNSGNDAGLGGNANAQCYPPLGIISLGTALLNYFGDRVDITLLDGQVDTLEETLSLLRKLRPDIVGVSMYCLSIRNTIRIICEAKAIGAKTILGNDHAAFHHRILLEKVADLDYVCLGDVGEITIVPLVRYLFKELTVGQVPNLAFRDEVGDIRTTAGVHNETIDIKQRATILDSIAVPNRSLLAPRYWRHYLQGFLRQNRKLFNPAHVTGVATINRARGCARSKDSCRYCGIVDLTPRGSSATMFWNDVRSASSQIRANVLYEAFDSATSWPSLISSWANNRPDDLSGIRFFMYAQAAETSARTVRMFSDLGVFCVNTGFDSGDDATLKLLKGPRDSIERNRSAARLWTDAGIEIYTSFVLVGLGDEMRTRRSLDQTLAFAAWLASETSTVSLDCALLYPDVSSTVGKWLWHPEGARSEATSLGWDFINHERLAVYSKKWRNEVFLEPLQLAADFADICGVKPEVLFEYSTEIRKISTASSLNFGLSQGGPTL